MSAVFYTKSVPSSGSGSGYGYGDGDGSGDGSGIKSIGKKFVDYIDGVPTIIHSHRGNLAKGVIVNLADFTETETWVVKQNDTYAHGKTAREATRALEEKLIAMMSVDERIAEFRRIGHSQNKKYPARHFFEWHGKLTGSCESGRIAFAKSRNIDIDHDTMTVKEFIDLTKDAFGSEVIARLAKKE
jgi:hypothetical protein